MLRSKVINWLCSFMSPAVTLSRKVQLIRRPRFIKHRLMPWSCRPHSSETHKHTRFLWNGHFGVKRMAETLATLFLILTSSQNFTLLPFYEILHCQRDFLFSLCSLSTTDQDISIALYYQGPPKVLSHIKDCCVFDILHHGCPVEDAFMQCCPPIQWPGSLSRSGNNSSFRGTFSVSLSKSQSDVYTTQTRFKCICELQRTSFFVVYDTVINLREFCSCSQMLKIPLFLYRNPQIEGKH